jgi:hypothetical protein
MSLLGTDAGESLGTRAALLSAFNALGPKGASVSGSVI